VRTLAVVVILSALAAGCAPNAMIIAPGELPLVAQPAGEKARGPLLWVGSARDVRPQNRAGAKLGTLYTRIQKTPIPAFLDRNPELYVREQLGRFLFNRGLEAPGASAAAGFLSIELEDFSITEIPGSVWDEITLRIVYTVRFSDRGGREIGSVRLEGGSQITSPGNSRRALEEGFRGALAESFDSLARSEVFRRSVESLSR
jgi:hypothetical protein